MSETINSCGNFEIKKDEAPDNLWLYWLGKPIKHLTIDEFGDLRLLMDTTMV